MLLWRFKVSILINRRIKKIPSFGTVAALAEETAASLAAYYQKMLAEDQVDIFVLGDVNEAELVPLFKQLPFTPREEGKAAIFYNQPIRNVIEERTEREVLAQSKLNLAYNTDIYYGDSYYFALQVFNGIFGGFPHSKLFMNVREKEHLAYYASSSIDTFRGFMTVQTGIDGKNRNQVLRLISTELENIRLGKISELEIEQTKAMLKNQYILALDNAGAWLEKEYLNQLMPQTMLTAEEWIARINAVTISEIQEVAKRLELQAIFFWKEKRKMIKKDYAQIKETLYTETLANGLKVYLLPKNDFQKTYGLFTTDYGSIDNTFVPIGQEEMIEVPDGIAHFLEHKMFEKEDGDVFKNLGNKGLQRMPLPVLRKRVICFQRRIK